MATHTNSAADQARGRVILNGATLTPRDEALAAAALGVGLHDDQALADLIDRDGRERLRQGFGVELERYLAAIPGLAGRPCALDAAIEMTLRGMAAAGTRAEEAAGLLAERH